MLKDANCADLNRGDVGREVTLAGWVNRRRDHGNLIFVDLRDRSGIVQIVFNPSIFPEAHKLGEELRSEWVVQIVGRVALRPKGTDNPAIPSGEVEVIAERAQVLNSSKQVPFYINEDSEVEEALRLRYRYLYLRRPRLLGNMALRHKATKFMRDFLDARGFLEVETPILIKSTPEGARDYLVPSRVYPGHFYALPQSPQQLKQLLMVGGIERYFQIARCFRDEDLRADRQPEFTQLDLEMSFVDEGDILDLIEELYISLVELVTSGKRVIKPFPRLTYANAMSRFGTDKPDLRYGMELVDVSEIAARSEFQVFQEALKKKGVVKGFAALGCADYSRRQLDELTELAKTYGAKGLVTVAYVGDGSGLMEEFRSVLTRFMSADDMRLMAHRIGARQGDLLCIVVGECKTANQVLGQLRRELGKRLKLADPGLLAFAFVTEFPLFEWNDEEKRWDSAHHPFTAPVEADISLLDKEPGVVRSRAYDLVCNDNELASGSIRIHQRGLQERIFRLLGYTEEQMEERFGHLLEALEYGAPPHGGIAPGIDRLVMVLAGEESLREVIAFPKTQNAQDLLFGAPSPARGDQLRELHLKVIE